MGHHDFFTLLTVAYVAIIMLLRVRRIKALRSLSKEDKLKLFDIKSSNLQYVIYLLVLFGGIIIFHYRKLKALPQSLSNTSLLTIWITWCVLLVLSGLYLRWNFYNNLKKAGLSESYTKSVLINTIIVYVAITLFLIGLYFNTTHLHYLK
jgi:hypothetical protein